MQLPIVAGPHRRVLLSREKRECSLLSGVSIGGRTTKNDSRTVVVRVE